MANTHLYRAKKEKNDEFYTTYKDIEDELQYYPEAFKDKVVYCNCDRPFVSEFWNYFEDNFNSLGLKKLVATYFDRSRFVWKTEIISATDNTRTVLRTKLAGDGSFQSEECISFINEVDIVVTNPPFSIFRNYFDLLVDGKKKYIIIGSQNAICYKDIFPHILSGEVYIGYITPSTFKNKNLNTEYLGFSRWFTNLKPNKEKPFLELTKSYNEEEYPELDNFKAININRTKDIPYDYSGVMAVPISYMKWHNPRQFDLLGATITGDPFAKGIFVDVGNQKFEPRLNGRYIYKRLFIRRSGGFKS